ncbi:hypothetical protein RvY_18221 [Ramazzottius varieornatus]|uniref:PAW domain-containing protein n=1 Tax=Ramazzottius varieornatus TaxID=947166 RepID=A0A1D1W8D3_RAMVA|nr:hypothetical protein RvY_18221 [Ramazzottius varieornatus]
MAPHISSYMGMDSCCQGEPEYPLKDKSAMAGPKPMTYASRRLRYMHSGRSNSDRRPSVQRERDLDNYSHRRTASLFAKVSEKQKQLAQDAAALTSGAFHILNHVIRLTEEEVAQGKLQLKYSSRSDEYKRPTAPTFFKGQRGWNSLVFAERNMELVTEHRQIAETDKVMVYLSRNPGSISSFIQWKFDFSETGLRVDRFGLRFLYDTSEDGCVRAFIKADTEELEEGGSVTSATMEDSRVAVFSSPTVRYIPEIHGWSKFSLIAELSCKRGSCVFHHSQLFLQDRAPAFFETDIKKYPFKVDISFL